MKKRTVQIIAVVTLIIFSLTSVGLTFAILLGK